MLYLAGDFMQRKGMAGTRTLDDAVCTRRLRMEVRLTNSLHTIPYELHCITACIPCELHSITVWSPHSTVSLSLHTYSTL